MHDDAYPAHSVSRQPSSTAKKAKSQEKYVFPKRKPTYPSHARLEVQIFAQTVTGHERMAAGRHEAQGHAPLAGRTDIGQVGSSASPPRIEITSGKRESMKAEERKGGQ
jgi:hypothetical protein